MHSFAQAYQAVVRSDFRNFKPSQQRWQLNSSRAVAEVASKLPLLTCSNSDEPRVAVFEMHGHILQHNYVWGFLHKSQVAAVGEVNIHTLPQVKRRLGRNSFEVCAGVESEIFVISVALLGLHARSCRVFPFKCEPMMSLLHCAYQVFRCSCSAKSITAHSRSFFIGRSCSVTTADWQIRRCRFEHHTCQFSNAIFRSFQSIIMGASFTSSTPRARISIKVVKLYVPSLTVRSFPFGPSTCTTAEAIKSQERKRKLALLVHLVRAFNSSTRCFHPRKKINGMHSKPNFGEPTRKTYNSNRFFFSLVAT